MSASALYAAAGVLVAIAIGMALAWKKPDLVRPYVYMACVATTTAVLVDMCSTHTLAAILFALLTSVSAVSAFSSFDRPLVVCVSATLVVAACISPALSVTELFVPLAVAGVFVVLGTTFFTAKRGFLRLFIVGAAAPIGVVDALYALVWQRHPTLLSAFATNDASSEEVEVVLITAVLSVASGLVLARRKCCVAFVPVITGSFLASLGVTAFAWVVLDSDMSMKAFTTARIVTGVALCALGWFFGPSSPPSPSAPSSPRSLVKTPAAASSNLCTAKVVLAPPTKGTGTSVLTTPSGDFARDLSNV